MRLPAITLYVMFTIYCRCMVSATCGAHGDGELIRDVVHEQYTALYTEARRGVPDHLLVLYYTSFIDSLKAHVMYEDSSLQDFGAYCLQGPTLLMFKALSAIKMLRMTIWGMLAADNTIFYLGDDIPDSDLFPLGSDQEDEIDDLWKDSMDELKREPDMVRADRVALLPKTVKFFFDPSKDAVESDLEDVRDKLSVNNHYMNAKKMVTHVLVMVMRMEFLQVKRESSLQILVHCVAFVFNNLRAARFEGANLPVLTFYLPFYEDTYRALTENKDTTSVMKIDEFVIKNHLGDVIDRLSSFDSWGRLSNFSISVFHPIVVSPIEDQIFSSSILNAISSNAQISYPASGQAPTHTPSAMHTSSAMHIPSTMHSPSTMQYNLTVLNRSGMQCNQDLFYYHNNPPHPSSSLFCCCANLCKNSDLLATVNVYSEDDCCGYCNQGSCNPGGSNPIGGLASVHVEPYGYQPENTIPIII